MQSCYQERLIYFWRHGLYGHVRLMCELGIKEKSNNLILFLWHGLSLAKLGFINESKEEIAKLEQRKDLILVFKTALYFVGKEANEENLNEKYQEIIKLINDINSFASCNSAQIAWLFGDIPLAEKILGVLTPTLQSRALNGWILFTKGKYQEALNVFIGLLSDPLHAYDLLPLYGKAITLSALGQNADSFQVMSQIISKYKFPEMLLEKCRVHMALYNWDLTLSIANEVKNDLICQYEYHIIEIITAILAKDDFKLAEESVTKFLEVAQNIEGRNYHELQKVSLLIATLCTQNFQFVDKAMKIAKIASDNENCDSMTYAVLGDYLLLAQNYIVAIPSLQKAIEKLPMNKFAAEKLISVMIELGRFSEAQDQLDMLEITGSSSLDTYLLQARLFRVSEHKQASAEFLITELEKVVEQNVINDELFGEQKGIEYPIECILKRIVSMRFDTIVGILDELIFYNHSLTKTLGDDRANRLIEVFNKLDRIAPQYQPFKFAKGTLLMRIGKVDEALVIFQRLLLSSSVCRLQYCLLYIANMLRENHLVDEAKAYLKEAIEADPTLVNNLDYAFTNVKLNANKENPRPDLEAVVPYFERESRSVPQYAEFFDICFSFDEYQIPTSMLKSANSVASNNYEKALIMSKQAIIYGSRNQFEKASAILSKLKTHEKYMDLGYSTEAIIKIKFNKDSKGYLQSFIELHKISQSAKHKEILGDAYATIYDFDKAAHCYEFAINPKSPDFGLLKKLITVLVDAHRFDDAANALTRRVSYLKGNIAVPLYLIKVLVTLKRYKEAKACIDSTMRLVVPSQVAIFAEILEQKGIVYSKLGESEEAEKCFTQSLQKYESILTNDNTTKYAHSLRTSASNVCIKLGENGEDNNREKALQYYRKALEMDDSNATAVTKIFNLYRKRADQARCVSICNEFLEKHPKNESVILLLTSAENRDYAKSIKLMEDLLNEKPKLYRLLVRYVEVCSRAGMLANIKERVAMYENDKTSSMEFVRGLYHLYFSDIPKAIEHFNKSVQSNHWRLQSQLMLFSCLTNPNKKFVWLESGPLSDEKNIEDASKILSKMKVTDNERKMLNAELYSSMNTDESIEKALQLVKEVFRDSRTNIGVITALARYQLRLGDSEEAKRTLTMIGINNAFHDNAQFYEEAYLMKAKLSEESPNPRSAHQYIFLALDINKSCVHAWEMNAKMYLKSKMYAEAINPFQRVWDLSSERDLEAGYNLAYCALMAKKPELALQVCHTISEINPVYKDIKHTIMIPAYKILYQ